MIYLLFVVGQMCEIGKRSGVLRRQELQFFQFLICELGLSLRLFFFCIYQNCYGAVVAQIYCHHRSKLACAYFFA